VNYLAHAFLSKENEELLVGNFIADHIRGNNFTNYSKGIVEGIQLHRQIDAFTDSHELFKLSKRVFYNGFEKHSGILVDIYFDHLLAKNFEQYHPQNLNQFSEKVYSVYSEFEILMPDSSRRFLNYVRTNNIYFNYSTLEGIETVLKHLSHRIAHGIELQLSLENFKKNETELQNNFLLFMEDLKGKFDT